MVQRLFMMPAAITELEIDDYSTHRNRLLEKLRRDLGHCVLTALADPKTIEIMLNADGILWQECLGKKMHIIGKMLPSRAEAVMRTIATCLDSTITRKNPILEGELPLDGSRFAGQLPPIVHAPTFAIRKKASAIFSLDKYVEEKIITAQQKKIIAKAVREHRNILVIGGTGSGKTTLANAIIHQMVEENEDERIFIIEDTGEIQCSAKNFVQYHTTLEVTMMHLLKTTLRMRPDRILVGEVRGPEALDLLMAWNTGHEGGVATLHANNAKAGLDRLAMLISNRPQSSSLTAIQPYIPRCANRWTGTLGRRYPQNRPQIYSGRVHRGVPDGIISGDIVATDGTASGVSLEQSLYFHGST
jgi:P-type conjugative transfer ATPase TrbB